METVIGVLIFLFFVVCVLYGIHTRIKIVLYRNILTLCYLFFVFNFLIRVLDPLSVSASSAGKSFMFITGLILLLFRFV